MEESATDSLDGNGKSVSRTVSQQSLNADGSSSSAAIKIFDQHSSKLVYDSSDRQAAYKSLSTKQNVPREFGAGCLW